MSGDYRTAYKKNRVRIVRGLANPDAVAGLLFQSGIFNDDIHETVKEIDENEQKTRMILDMLSYRGKNGLAALHQAFLDTSNKELAEGLAPYVLADAEGGNKTETKDNQFPWLVADGEFQRMLAEGTFQSYDHRLSIGGPCKAGKSTLASVLIGDEAPSKWKSTDGLVIYFGSNGIDIEKKKMVPFKDDDRIHRIIRGNPSTSKEMTTQETTTKPIYQVQTKKSDERNSFLEEMPNLERRKLKLRSDILEEVKNGKYRIEIAPSDLVDFGGQKSYDMTHQLFIQHSGSFLLMFDGRIGLNTQLDEYPKGVTAASILRHWVDSILTYTEDTDDIMPMVLFAATHRDLLEEDSINIKEGFIKDIKQIFSEHEKKDHIHTNTVYFINARDRDDTEIQRMTDQIVLFAMKQSTWGQRRPMQWVPLEQQLSSMRKGNINIVTKEELQIVNMQNEELALNERQLKDFLLFQHSIGKLMYYNLPLLDNFVIIHPPALVNILRSFVTDEMFFPEEKDLKSILQTMNETGQIYKADLLKLWQQNQFRYYLPDENTKEFVVQLLIHLDILVIPKTLKQDSATDVFLVPCAIKSNMPLNFNSHDSKRGSSMCLRYSLTRHSIPTALAYKIIGATVSSWPLKYENKKPCLFHKAVVLNVNEENELRVWLEDNQVMLYMVNHESLLLTPPDVAASVQECLTRNLESSLFFHYNSFGRKIDSSIVSKLYSIEVGFPCGSDVCYMSAQEVKKIDNWTCGKGKQHETRYLQHWFFDRSQETCGIACKGLDREELELEPSEKHLVRLGSQIGIRSFEFFFLKLGMTRKDWEETEYSYCSQGSIGIKSMALKHWKCSMTSKNQIPTFQLLSDALKEVDIDIHLICQIFREKMEMLEIADFSLHAIPSDQHLKELSGQIGDSPLQLGIELGLTFAEIQQLMYSFPKDMPGLIEHILVKWKSKSKVKTIHSLILALARVGSGGVSYLQGIIKHTDAKEN